MKTIIIRDATAGAIVYQIGLLVVAGNVIVNIIMVGKDAIILYN